MSPLPRLAQRQKRQNKLYTRAFAGVPHEARQKFIEEGGEEPPLQHPTDSSVVEERERVVCSRPSAVGASSYARGPATQAIFLRLVNL